MSDEEQQLDQKVPEANQFIMDVKKFESDQETAQVNREYLPQTAINEANIESAEEAKREEAEMNRFLVIY